MGTGLLYPTTQTDEVDGDGTVTWELVFFL